MARQVAFSRFGGPEVLEVITVPDASPGPGELRIRQTAVGVNFTDIHSRRGDYANLHALPKPFVPGLEATGRVQAVGAGVEGFKVGDRVAYASQPMGAYCDARNFPAARCVQVPDGLEDALVAATLLKGMTLQVLLRRVHRVQAGEWIVVHSAAGGVGTLAGQWLRALGARAIGIVGSNDKEAAARAAGYEAVFVRGRSDWPARVRELVGGGVPVVYDPVGRDTWNGSLDCLAPRGHLICYGNSSGLVPPFSVNELRDRGSLTVSWIRFSDFTATPADLQASARELFAALGRGLIRPAAPHCLPLDQAPEAHRRLESGGTTGAIVLVP